MAKRLTFGIRRKLTPDDDHPGHFTYTWACMPDTPLAQQKLLAGEDLVELADQLAYVVVGCSPFRVHHVENAYLSAQVRLAERDRTTKAAMNRRLRLKQETR